MPAAAPVVVRGEQLAQRRQPVGRSMVASRIGQSPETPVAQSSGCEPRLRAELRLRCAERRIGVEEMAGELLEHRGVGRRELSSRSSTWLEVHARSSARCAACGS